MLVSLEDGGLVCTSARHFPGSKHTVHPDGEFDLHVITLTPTPEGAFTFAKVLAHLDINEFNISDSIDTPEENGFPADFRIGEWQESGRALVDEANANYCTGVAQAIVDAIADALQRDFTSGEFDTSTAAVMEVLRRAKFQINTKNL